MKARRFGRSRQVATASAVLIVALLAGSSLAGTGDDCPPNPEPGKCYEKVYRPAQYESYVDQEREQSSYQVEERRVLVRDAYVERYTVPAVYQTIDEQVLVRPAHTEWKRGVLLDRTQVAPGQTRMLPNGEVLCLVEIPAEYRTVTRQVMVSPAHVEQRIVPAEYRTVIEQRPVQAAYRTVTRQRKIRDASFVWQVIACNGGLPARRDH